MRHFIPRKVFRHTSSLNRVQKRNFQFLQAFFQYAGKLCYAVIRTTGAQQFSQKTTAKLMGRMGVSKSLKHSPEMSEAELLANRIKWTGGLKKFWIVTNICVFGFMPVAFWIMHKRKKRWVIEHTAALEKHIEAGMGFAMQGNLKSLGVLQSEMADLQALGGVVNQEHYDEMISVAHTVKTKKRMRRAKRAAKKGDVAECAKLLEEIWESRKITEVGVESEELDELMLEAHNNFITQLLGQANYSRSLKEVWRLIENIKSYSKRYSINIEDAKIQELWRFKVNQLKSEHKFVMTPEEIETTKVVSIPIPNLPVPAPNVQPQS